MIPKPKIPKWDSRNLSFPLVSKYQCKNGWQILHKYDSRFPTISLRLLLNGGCLYGEKSGVSSLTDSLVNHYFHKNWKNYTLSGDLQYNTQETNSVFSLDALSSEWKSIGTIFQDILNIPRIDYKYGQHLCTIRKQSILHNLHNPQFLARWCSQELFYQGSILSAGVSGSLQSLASIDIQDIDNSLERYRSPSGTLVVVGDIELSKVISWVENELPQTNPCPNPTMQFKHSYDVFFLHCPSSQTVIKWMQSLSNKTEFSLANEIIALSIGDMFTSRLNQKLRVQEGLTYGISASIWEGFSRSFFICQTMVEQVQQLKALNLIKHTLKEAHLNWTEQELQMAKQNLWQHLLDTSSTPYDLADLIENWISSDQPIEAFNRLSSDLSSLSLGTVISAAEQLNLTKEMVLIVGKDKDSAWREYRLNKIQATK